MLLCSGNSDFFHLSHMNNRYPMGLFTKKYFYVYISTNESRSRLYTGLSGSLAVTLTQWQEERFALSGIYSDCRKLVYWERYTTVEEALSRERVINKLSFRKKMALILSQNPSCQPLQVDMITP